MAATRSTDGPKPGLRERKKARTRASIREHALRLFREQGYAATTVEQIAEAAEVSPSTFFRYFPTKEDVVLQDDMDLVLMEALERQPPGLSPIAAIRAATRETVASYSPEDLARLREMAEFSLSVPEVRARSLDEFARTIQVMAEAIAKRAGRAPDDFAARTIAGAVVGVIMSATMPWTDWTSKAASGDMFQRIDDALALLEAGLPL
jgi:AcrR family transcriptional regulator